MLIIFKFLSTVIIERQEKFKCTGKRRLEVYNPFLLHSSLILAELRNRKQMQNRQNAMIKYGYAGSMSDQEKAVENALGGLITALIKTVTITRDLHVTFAYTEKQM